MCKRKVILKLFERNLICQNNPGIKIISSRSIYPHCIHSLLWRREEKKNSNLAGQAKKALNYRDLMAPALFQGACSAVLLGACGEAAADAG